MLIAIFLLFPAFQVCAADDEQGSWTKASQEIGEAAAAVSKASRESWQKTKVVGGQVIETTTTTTLKVWGKTKEISTSVWDKTSEKSAEWYDLGKVKIRQLTGSDKE